MRSICNLNSETLVNVWIVSHELCPLPPAVILLSVSFLTLMFTNSTKTTFTNFHTKNLKYSQVSSKSLNPINGSILHVIVVQINERLFKCLSIKWVKWRPAAVIACRVTIRFAFIIIFPINITRIHGKMSKVAYLADSVEPRVQHVFTSNIFSTHSTCT